MKIGRQMILATIASMFLMLASGSAQQKPIFVDRNSGWGNTGIQSTPPVAFIVSAGICIEGNNCNSSGGPAMSYLVPMTFYPSGCTQHLTISSGTAFSAIANVFAQGGELVFQVPRVLSNDGSVPSNFFQANQSDGGPFGANPAVITSIEITIAPFTFQLTSGGWWQTVGENGNPPALTISVFGSH
jgi:hypothetical protein